MVNVTLTCNIDECLVPSHNCDENATCGDTIDNFEYRVSALYVCSKLDYCLFLMIFIFTIKDNKSISIFIKSRIHDKYRKFVKN